MTKPFTETFHSSATAYIIMWRSLMVGLGSLIIAAAIFGQIKSGRFPAYKDLALSLLLPVGAYAVLAAVTYIGCMLFPVRLGPGGIRSSNFLGFPAFVGWSDIREANVEEYQGIPYISISAAGRLQSVMVPIWLTDWDGFVEAVKRYAEAGNPLLELFSEEEVE